jgi:hypothetical protein
MSVHLFEIFSGTAEMGALWIESAIGLDKATQRMNEFAGAKPGAYFVFDTQCHKVIATADSTGGKPSSNRKTHSKN